MNDFLKSLWYSSLMEDTFEKNDEEKRLLIEAAAYEDELIKNMTDEQKENLFEYSRCLGEISCVCDAKAFVKGVKFAASFLIEALNNED